MIICKARGQEAWASMEDAWFDRYESRQQEFARLWMEAQLRMYEANREAFLHPYGIIRLEA